MTSARTRASSYRTRIGRKWRRLRTRTIRVMLQHSEPEMIALGAAVGVFVAVSPWVGFHTALAVLLATLLGANKLAAAAFVWAANPVFFYVDYVVGKWVLDLVHVPARSPSAVGWHELAGRLTRGILLPVLLGSLIFGLACGAVTYFVAVRVVTYYRRRAAQRKAQAAQEPESLQHM